jgi:predicted phage replisome organizer
MYGGCEMADIHWIKLKTNMFDDEKIRLIEVMPEADAILSIWIRLLVLAGKTNDSGLIYIQRDMPYSDEMLAALFRRPVNTVRLAMKTLEEFDMIDVSRNGVIGITHWDKHRNIEGMEKVRLQTAERVQRFRDKQRQQQIGSSVTGNVTVTDGNATESDSETEYKKHNAASAVPSVQLESEFDDVWNRYPNKKGKKQALSHYKAWRKKSAKNTNAYLLERLRLYQQDLAANPWKAPMNGATWFNGRFDDDYQVPNSGSMAEPESREDWFG